MINKPVHEVSERILEIVRKNGFITLNDLEKELNVSYNLLFLAIDRMVSHDKISLKRCGKEYIIFFNNFKSDTLPYEKYIDEYLWQDM